MRPVIRVFRKVAIIMRPFWKAYLVILGFILSLQLFTLVWPYLIGKVFDGLFNKRSVTELFSLLGGVLVLELLGRFVSFKKDEYEINHIDFSIARYVSLQAMRAVSRFSLGQHMNENSGLRQNVVNKGEAAIIELNRTVIYDLLPMIFSIAIVVGALFYLSHIFALIVLAGVVVYIGSSAYLVFRTYREVKALNNENHHIAKEHTEIYRHMKLILLYGQADRMQQEYENHNLAMADRAMKFWISYCGALAYRDSTINIMRAALLAVGISLVYQAQYTPGQVITVCWLANMLMSSLGGVGSLQRRLVMNYASVERYFQMLEIAPSVEVVPNPIRPLDFRGKIEFRNVSFRYPSVASYDADDEVVTPATQEEDAYTTLTNVSFTIEAGETVAFVGRSGAGKTSIINLLMRGYDPDEGQILIDGNDLRLLDLDQFRNAVGIVEQDVELLDRSLRNNILFGLTDNERSTMTDERLQEIAKKSSIDKFAHRLGAQGLDTLIGEKGIRLSGGERQRVGIARALVKDPQVLIFDEATSNLDSANEADIQEAMKVVLAGRTGIIIAHRLSTVRDADKIIVLDKGNIIGIGKHRDLCRSCDTYIDLVQKQGGMMLVA